MTENCINKKQAYFLIRLISMCIANTKHDGDWMDIESRLIDEFDKLGD